MPRIDLGRYGFSVAIQADNGHLRTALTLEGLGFETLWINGGDIDRLDRMTDLLAATTTAIVGSAVIPPDRYGPDEVSALFERAESAAPGRLMVGLGSSHRPRAFRLLGQYVDALDAVPKDRRLLAALGPRALTLARDRFAGAMPMLLTEQQTAEARRAIGDDRILSVGLYVVLDADPAPARTAARAPLKFLTTLPAYRKSLERQGFSAADIAELSDHLVDTLTAWGSPRQVLDHADRLLAAGADHIQFTALGTDGQPTGVAAAKALAAELG